MNHLTISQKDLDILNLHLKAENKHDWPATRETLHPDCLFEDVALGKVYKGREGAGQYYKLWWDAFDLIVVSEKRHFTEEGIAIAEPRYTGTHIGDFYGIPPTGKKIDFRIAVFIGFRDGLLAGERFYYDSRTLFQQMGLKEMPKFNHREVS